MNPIYKLGLIRLRYESDALLAVVVNHESGLPRSMCDYRHVQVEVRLLLLLTV